MRQCFGHALHDVRATKSFVHQMSRLLKHCQREHHSRAQSRFYQPGWGRQQLDANRLRGTLPDFEGSQRF
jgi:hypothetical protein